MLPGWILLVGLVFQVGDQVSDTVPGASIRGSPQAMDEQHKVALEHGLPFFHTEDEIRAAVQRGQLVELPGGEHYEVADFVDLPYVIPATRLFVERTAVRYQQACGEPLVVTSGVRAIEEQPPNAHEQSVHPAGMALDFRVSQQEVCREWLQNRLLELEQTGVINATREYRPPHFHLAVYPSAYTAYVAAQQAAVREEAEPSQWRRPSIALIAIAILLGMLAGGYLLVKRRGGGAQD